MIKLTVIYPHPKDVQKFDAHYLGTHVPLAQAIPGLQRLEVARLIAGPDGPPPYHLIAELWFESEEALRQGLASPHGQAATEDVALFAPSGPVVRLVSAIDVGN